MLLNNLCVYDKRLFNNLLNFDKEILSGNGTADISFGGTSIMCCAEREEDFILMYVFVIFTDNFLSYLFGCCCCCYC